MEKEVWGWNFRTLPLGLEMDSSKISERSEISIKQKGFQKEPKEGQNYL